MGKPNFSTVTEVTGNRVTQEQLDRMYSRYRFALEFCKNKNVLEVACGSGQGLGYLAKVAARVVGGDIDETNLDFARKYYRDRSTIELKAMDAHALPFSADTFDVVLLYEAIYYLKEPELFMREALRVLKKDGRLLIATVNKEWSDFNPSPYSFSYFSAQELYSLLERAGFKRIRLFGDCPVKSQGLKSKALSALKRLAVSLHLIPRTMKAKEFLKRLFIGKLMALPSEVTDEMGKSVSPVILQDYEANTRFKVIFITGEK